MEHIEIGTEVRVPDGRRGRVMDVLEEPWLRVMVENSATNEYRRDELRVWGRNER
jgi:hypothetical protein